MTHTAKRWSGFLRSWKDYRVEATEYRELDDQRILVLMRGRGRGKTSGLEVSNEGATVFRIRGGKVSSLVIYRERDRALADLGVAE